MHANSANEKGASSLDVMQALHWESLVTPSQPNLGFSNTTVETIFIIFNRPDRSRPYKFSHKGAGAMEYLMQRLGSISSSTLGMLQQSSNLTR